MSTPDESDGASAGVPRSESGQPLGPVAIETARPRSRGRRAGSIALKVAAVLAAVAIIVWANQVGAGNERVLDAIRRYGYLGLFVAAAISGFNVVIPVPVISMFPLLMEAGLEPIPTIIITSAGMTLGDMVGYLLGRAGRAMVEKPQWIQRMERIQDRHGLAPYVLLFLWAAFAPLPNEIVVIPMALIGCRGLGIMAAALSGNIIFNTLLAFGFQGFFDFI